MNYGDIYNAEYYKKWGKDEVPYESSKDLKDFFDMVADKIVDLGNIQSVLDVGCAMGHLVASLRSKGIDAYGIDVSEYAISKVRNDIRPYCKVCSAVEPLPNDFPKKYDLVVTIEVAEHLYEEDGAVFIKNICGYSDKIIFSSSSNDILEKTHFNVQQPEYWAKRFVEFQFYHDLYEDLSYISPDAVLYCKNNYDKKRVVELYERKLRLENVKFGSAILNNNDTSNKLAEGNKYLQLENTKTLREMEVLIEEKAALQQVIDESTKEKAALQQVIDELTKEKGNLQHTIEEIAIEKISLMQEIDETTKGKMSLTVTIDDLNRDYSALKSEIFTKDKEFSEIILEMKIENLKLKEVSNLYKFELDRIRNSKGFRLLKKLYRLEDIIIPRSSKRFKCAKLFYYLPRYIKLGYLQKAMMYIRKNGFRGLRCKIKSVAGNNISVLTNIDSYENWIAINEPDKEELLQQRSNSHDWKLKISIVVPLYNTPMAFLKELINSIISQTYENWELCLADGNSKNQSEIEKVILSYNNKKIKYVLLKENKGISGNTNSAISIASGDFIAFVDHDDTIAPFALYEIAKCIQYCPDADFIYSDDDRINKDGSKRSFPCFKPDYTPDRLRCCNYIGHLSVIKKSLLDIIGLLNPEYDGSQDHDLVLRATEKANRIEHIPKILYHWRMHENSVALNGDSKMYASLAAKKALAAHLERLNIEGKVIDGIIPNSYKIEYDLKDNDKVSIIIPTMDHVKELKLCLETILNKTTYKNYEIILVENNSKDPDTFEYYKTLDQYECIRTLYWPNQGFNYSAIVNYGVKHAAGKYVLILNNDTEIITPQWLEEMMQFAQFDDVGIVGAKLYYPDNTIWNTGVALSLNASVTLLHNKLPRDSAGYYGQANIIQNFSALAGACIMLRKELYMEVGGCDEINFPVAHNDMDLSLKLIAKGKRLIFTPYAELYHYESKSRGSDFEGDKLKRFITEDTKFLHKWQEYLKFGDPLFNINFKDGNPFFQIKDEKINYKY